MFIHIDKNAALPITKQLYNHIKTSILQGTLSADTKMPSTRSLADNLEIARSTVVECYEQLVAEGFLYSVEGSGTYVSGGITFEVYGLGETSLPSEYQHKLYTEPKEFISFRPGVPDLGTIPIHQWGRLYREVTAKVKPEDLDYNSVHGVWELRKVLTTYLKRVRGVETRPENILITGGAAQAFSLLSELVGREEHVLVEDPASSGMIQTLESHQVKCEPIPVDEEGLMTHLLSDKKAAMVFTTPSHQFPTGVVMSIRRRIELIQYARANNIYIIEDDYDSEFRYDGSPIQSMQNLAPEQVIYVGTFSKTFMPAIRMGYMIVPDQLIDVLGHHKYASDLHSPVLEQMTMAKFIHEGMMDRHIRRMRKLYGRRRDSLVKALTDAFGLRIKISGDGAGLHLVVTLDDLKDKDTLKQQLKDEKVLVTFISEYYQSAESSSPNQLILGFGNVQEEQLVEGVERIKRAINHGSCDNDQSFF